ncbi:universal stress protein [Hyphomicrobium denitrificans]|uniref:universal stress protein n=1 Tax=Hyphomicrobium denitrificans TaxID=53399 RepID=UPI001FCB5EEC|nr:universal stress protein [Hyphomicrobium denitrificans]
MSKRCFGLGSLQLSIGLKRNDSLLISIRPSSKPTVVRVGTGGKGNIARLVLGSVSSSVVAHAHCL